MEDPLQSPTLTASIAYLEERDLIPPVSRSTSITESMFYSSKYLFLMLKISLSFNTESRYYPDN
jgi:hypothetical protein